MAGNEKNDERTGMTPSEKFFFDLNGFLVVRGVLSPDFINEANAAIDAHCNDIKERLDPELRNTKPGSPFAGEMDKGRRDLGGMLSWPEPDRKPFRELLSHPKLLPYLLDLCGQGYRMDHLPLLISQHKGSEGFKLHGGPVLSSGRFNPTLQYRCFNGELYNSLLAMSVQLSDHNEGDGGFCVVRGSHKMNFPPPEDFIHGAEAQEHLFQPVTKKGDVVFFSEATVHGAMPWKADHERRILLYRFAPSTAAYGRTYAPEWPQEMLQGLTPNQRAVLEPPYANRLDRPIVSAGAQVPSILSRPDAKKDFDKEVFGTTYF